eukprot:613116_1
MALSFFHILLLSTWFLFLCNSSPAAFEWYTSQTRLPGNESDHASCIDSQGRLHIVGGSGGEDPIRRIDLTHITFRDGVDQMYINDNWEFIQQFTDYTQARDLRLTAPSYTTSNGKIYMIPIIIDNTKDNTVKAPPLIIYDCDTASFIPYQSYNYTPIESAHGDYGGYSCLTSTDTHVYFIGGRPKSLPPFDGTWKTYVIDTLQIYNIADDEWTYGTPIPAQGTDMNGVEAPACAVDATQTNLYVFGGQNDYTYGTKRIFKYNIKTDAWSLLPNELDRNAMEGRTVMNPNTRDIFIIGGSYLDALDVDIFNPFSASITPNKVNFTHYIGGSSLEIYGDLLLAIGGYDTETFVQNDRIQYAFLPELNPNIDLHASECVRIGDDDNDICWTFDIDLTLDRVFVTAIGPADRWYGVGLGSNTMEGTYALVVFNDDVVMERRLGNPMPNMIEAPGTLLQPQSIVITSTTAQDNVRTVTMWLPRDAISLYDDDEYYTFPTSSDQSIGSFIMARGAVAQIETDEFEDGPRSMHHGFAGHSTSNGFVFDAVTTQEPTSMPTPSPIASTQCDEGELDIIFLVDNSCNIDYDECMLRQDGIGELIGTVKHASTHRRIAYFEFTQFVHFVVELDDPLLNNPNGNQQAIAYEYAKFIKSDASFCSPYPSNTSEIDLRHAISETLQHFRDKYESDKYKKIVLINNCEDAHIQDACDDNMPLKVNGDSVEITVMNMDIIGGDIDNTSTYAQCFTKDPLLDVIPMSSASPESFQLAIPAFITSICTPNEDDTLDPTIHPTVSPLSEPLCENEQLDIMFLVDNSCVLHGEECAQRQDGIAELLASIKQNTDPRVGYIQFGDFTRVVVDLDHSTLNELDLPDPVIEDYATVVRNLECDRIASHQASDLYYVVNNTLSHFNSVTDSKGRHKKIVLFNNCNFEDTRFVQDACNISRMAHAESVEFTVVNIGVEEGNINLFNHTQCLHGENPDRMITIDTVQPESFMDVIPEFVDAVCKDNYIATDDPITQPTIEPTNMPTTCVGTEDRCKDKSLCCDPQAICDLIGLHGPPKCCLPLDVECDFNEECCGDSFCDAICVSNWFEFSSTLDMFSTYVSDYDDATEEPTREPTIEPTRIPTSKPTTRSPTESPIANTICALQKLDIVFLIDDTCGLTEEECVMRQDGISELLAALKQTTKPRVAYLEFNDVLDPIVSLKHPYFNNIKTSDVVIKDYVSTIKSLSCPRDVGNSVDLYDAIQGALNHFSTYYQGGSHKKIVIINHCDAARTENELECDIPLIVNGDPVEITVVNIGVVNGTMDPLYMNCLVDDARDRLFTLPNAQSDSFGDIITPFADAVCDENAVLTDDPTVSPSDKPSVFPTNNPTKSPAEEPTTSPTYDPSVSPTDTPSASPTNKPSPLPTIDPTYGPTSAPTDGPTPYPTPTPFVRNLCDKNDLDVVFVVDNSCVMDSECQERQDGLSELIASIKQGTTPRIAYATFGNMIDFEIHLDHSYFNDGTKQNVMHDYTKLIRDLSCDAVTTPSALDTRYAMNQTLHHFARYSDRDAHKKIIFINHCEDPNVDDACELPRVVLHDTVEVTVINIQSASNNISSKYMKCMVDDDRERLLSIVDINAQSFQDLIPTFVSAVCNENATPIPTQYPSATAPEPTPNPTPQPTPNPTHQPTPNPTPQPTPNPTHQPTPNPTPNRSTNRFTNR